MDIRHAVKYLSTVCVFMSLLKLSMSRESVWVMQLRAQSSSVVNVFPNYMYEGSYVAVRGWCEGKNENAAIEVQWMLLEIDCIGDMYKTITKEVGVLFGLIYQMSQRPSSSSSKNLTALGRHGRKADDVKSQNLSHNYEVINFFAQYSKKQIIDCRGKQQLSLEDESGHEYVEASGTVDTVSKNSRDFRVVRTIRRNKTADEVSSRVTEAWSHGMYHFFLSVGPAHQNASYAADIIVEMKGQYGYLSAIEWPLLPISGTMSLLYLVAGSAWIFLWASKQEHTRNIHMVIGVVAIAGSLGNTLCFIDLSVRNQDGIGVATLQWIGKLISNAQLSLTQLLLMVVSTGYGINRPKLSLFFIQVMVSLTVLSFAANCAMTIVMSESLKIKYQLPWLSTLVMILFALVMLVITGWVKIFAVHTFTYLFRRRRSGNRRKLCKFSVFLGSCIVTFAAHIAVGSYSISANGLFSECLRDWKHEWLFTTVSQLQIFGLLIVMLWLWRPIDEKKSGDAYHPLHSDEKDADGLSDDDRNNGVKFAMDSL